MKTLFTLLFVVVWGSFLFAQTITVDGDMSDWDASMQIDVPPNDVEEAGDTDDPNIDLVDIYVTHDQDSLYFRYVMNGSGTFHSLLDTLLYPSGAGFELNIDVDCDTSTGLNWGWWYTSSDFYLDLSHPYAENEPIEWELWRFNGANGSDWSYVPAGIACHVAYNLDDNELEVSIPRAEIGETNGELETTAFFAYASIWADPWPEDIAPNDIGSKRYVYRYGRKQITVDGDMSDWDPAVTQIDVAPNEVEGVGDSVDTNYDGVMDGVINPALDFKDLYITHDDDYLYVRIDINENGTFTDLTSLVSGGMQASLELFIDTDVDTSTGLTWGWWATSGDYWVNLSVPYGWPGFEVPHKYGINKFIGANGSDSQWEPLPDDSCLVAVNLDDNMMEVAIPRAAIGEIYGEHDSTAILFLAEDPTQGWVNDAAPNSTGEQRYVYKYGETVTAIGHHGASLPHDFTLNQNYPNPFNPTTTISFTMDKTQNVRLSVYNVLGQKVRTLVSGVQTAGTHKLIWNGKNDNGLNVPSGVYIYRLEGNKQAIAKKMILVR